MKLEKIKKDFRKHKAKYIFLCAAAIVLLLAVILLKAFVFIVIFIGLNVLMGIFLRAFKRNHMGIELVMFSTVLSGAVFGAKIGMIVGGITMALDYISSARISYFSIVTIPSYIAAGGLAALLHSMGYGIIFIGISLTLAYNLITNIGIIGGVLGGDILKCLRFSVTNIAFNVLLFWRLAPFFEKIMA
ncbi:MAG: hypothetical protein GY861_08400 [bacterium]|nr:hypothetical protein [bacterium]